MTVRFIDVDTAAATYAVQAVRDAKERLMVAQRAAKAAWDRVEQSGAAVRKAEAEHSAAMQDLMKLTEVDDEKDE